MSVTLIVILTIVLALGFDVVNGFHDAANSIATVVSTRVLTPRKAVIWAATFNFVALFVFKIGVADSIAKIIIFHDGDPAMLRVCVVMSGLIGAIAWNLLTWWWGLPASSSHALIGGVGGAGVAYAALERSGPALSILNYDNIIPVLKFIILAPLIGLVLGYLIMLLVYWVFRRMRPQRVDRTFRIGQLISSAAYSIGHGGNDAQKTMGIILMVLIASGASSGGKAIHYDGVPMWVIFASYGCMAFGTAIGGWRIVKTMGMGLTRLRPVGGFCAEVAGAITLFIATYLKVPVSTTHTITGAIIGVGSASHPRGIRWGLAGRIVWAWIFTIPAAAAVGAGCFALIRMIHPW